MSDVDAPQFGVYAVLPLRDIVVFPHMVVPLFVGRSKSIKGLENAMNKDRRIFLVTQKNALEDNPNEAGLYKVGVLCSLLQLMKLPDGTVKALVEGLERAKMVRVIDPDSPFTKGQIETLPYVPCNEQVCMALVRSVLSEFDKYVRLSKKIPPDVVLSISQIEDISRLTDTIISHIDIKISDKQTLLGIDDIEAKSEQLCKMLNEEISVMQIENKIKGRVKRQMEKTQREYYLSEQIKAIQKELGDSDEGMAEITELERKIKSLGCPKHVLAKAESELKKLKNMTSMSAESTIVRNYLDWIISLPWNKKSKLKKDMEAAENILDDNHYALHKVKERILEFLAVQKRNTKVKGPILCFVGPPGVGKTSLGKSIAKATGRDFIRNSLGGVRDEAEIRGHRRTYIGAMPGKIIQSMKKSKTINPLILLDEIDKIGSDFRGDPASALLEVLDPEHNEAFVDNYMDMEYDISNVMFVATANTLDMPYPLIDRMEIVRVSGYTEEEKLEIARRHLVNKQMKSNALKESEFSITDDALVEAIRSYTREAGVRGLEREISKICRKSVFRIEKDHVKSIYLDASQLKSFLGVKKYRFGLAEDDDLIGAATGLAWTELGGDLLTIEVVKVPGKGRIKSTGKLGEVMKESIEAAFSYIKSNIEVLNLDAELLGSVDLHVHVPEGATPKDGPSAGIAIVTAISSILFSIPVKKTVAMTGEVTLRGSVLPIGGLKEKLLAALRGGIKTVLIPEKNVRDLDEIPERVLEEIEVIPVSHVSEVLSVALARDPMVLAKSSDDDVNNEDKGDITQDSFKSSRNKMNHKIDGAEGQISSQ